ncbi:MAG: TraR/DksA family transcriptional regulator [Planctomycetota bacterium]|nr:TraR/DksA family transcriptional regulator [Planctomycetota bacterium]
MAKLPKAKQTKYRIVLMDILRHLGAKVERMEESVLLSDDGASPDESEEFGSEGYSREFQLGLIENEDEILQNVQEALDRVDAGTFGTCDSCEALIPDRRLQVVPYAKFCVKCQAAAEEGLLGED